MYIQKYSIHGYLHKQQKIFNFSLSILWLFFLPTFVILWVTCSVIFSRVAVSAEQLCFKSIIDYTVCCSRTDYAALITLYCSFFTYRISHAASFVNMTIDKRQMLSHTLWHKESSFDLFSLSLLLSLYLPNLALTMAATLALASPSLNAKCFNSFWVKRDYFYILNSLTALRSQLQRPLLH